MFGETTILGFTFSLIWGWILLVIWIALAFWPARVAARKGRSFFGYFLLSLFFFPLSLILAYVLPSRLRTQASQQVVTTQPTEE